MNILNIAAYRFVPLNDLEQLRAALKLRGAELGLKGTILIATEGINLFLAGAGGIRCEKAAPWLISQGFRKVYQLDGGILNYFEQCGGAHFRGECFVFDQRMALDAKLRESGGAQSPAPPPA